MNEKELGRALLNLNMAPSPATLDPRELTQIILRRDRSRIRLLTGLAIFFWFLTAAGVICLCPFYIMIVAPRLRAYQAGRALLENDWSDWARVGDWVAYWLLGWIISLLLAAVCTMLLIMLSRRATLRQINASLMEISDKLKQLGRSPPSETQSSKGTA
jgi:hypothetical protein